MLFGDYQIRQKSIFFSKDNIWSPDLKRPAVSRLSLVGMWLGTASLESILYSAETLEQ